MRETLFNLNLLYVASFAYCIYVKQMASGKSFDLEWPTRAPKIKK